MFLFFMLLHMFYFGGDTVASDWQDSDTCTRTIVNYSFPVHNSSLLLAPPRSSSLLRRTLVCDQGVCDRGVVLRRTVRHSISPFVVLPCTDHNKLEVLFPDWNALFE